MMPNYTLIRSRRKTILLRVSLDGGVEVRAPLNAPTREIDRFLAEKADWIANAQSVCAQRAEAKSTFSVGYGSRVLLRGDLFPVEARPGTSSGFDGARFYLPPGLSEDAIKRAVARLYRAIARQLLPDKVASFARQMGLAPSAVKINSAKTRWGSCSAKKSLNFSWRLILADEDAIAYVVVHELAHLKELNHSAAFWAIVERVLPDYRQRQQKLRALQARLSLEDWE